METWCDRPRKDALAVCSSLRPVRESHEVAPTGHDLLLVRHTEGVGMGSIYYGDPNVIGHQAGDPDKEIMFVCIKRPFLLHDITSVQKVR
jgi:hypothetical protein